MAAQSSVRNGVHGGPSADRPPWAAIVPVAVHLHHPSRAPPPPPPPPPSPPSIPIVRSRIDSVLALETLSIPAGLRLRSTIGDFIRWLSPLYSFETFSPSPSPATVSSCVATPIDPSPPPPPPPPWLVSVSVVSSCSCEPSVTFVIVCGGIAPSPAVLDASPPVGGRMLVKERAWAILLMESSDPRLIMRRSGFVLVGFSFIPLAREPTISSVVPSGPAPAVPGAFRTEADWSRVEEGIGPPSSAVATVVALSSDPLLCSFGVGRADFTPPSGATIAPSVTEFSGLLPLRASAPTPSTPAPSAAAVCDRSESRFSIWSFEPDGGPPPSPAFVRISPRLSLLLNPIPTRSLFDCRFAFDWMSDELLLPPLPPIPAPIEPPPPVEPFWFFSYSLFARRNCPGSSATAELLRRSCFPRAPAADFARLPASILPPAIFPLFTRPLAAPPAPPPAFPRDVSCSLLCARGCCSMTAPSFPCSWPDSGEGSLLLSRDRGDISRPRMLKTGARNPPPFLPPPLPEPSCFLRSACELSIELLSGTGDNVGRLENGLYPNSFRFFS
uniref:Uncharacterized protein n=1 Tax=Anopheles farauti TaxID=69004 RepID=A0A182Q9A3_9DIPT